MLRKKGFTEPKRYIMIGISILIPAANGDFGNATGYLVLTPHTLALQ